MMEVEINDKKGDTHKYKCVYKIEAIEDYIIVSWFRENVVWNVDDINSWNVNFLVNPEPEREEINDD